MCVLAASLGTPTVILAEDAAQSTDARFFAQTGYRVDRDAFWSYFQQRGGVATFGYPASRDFEFLGCTSQFFQRLVLQQCGAQTVGTLNLLDDGLLPYTRINGSTFPAVESTMKNSTPAVSDPAYGSKILEFVRANAQDTFEGNQVNFRKTFFDSVKPEVAGTNDPNILGLLALETWGAPTSKPAYDPSNSNFIYQRFQRGIMHFDKACACTQGLLLADYLKALVTGEGLPTDLEAQALTSILYRSAVVGATLPTGTTYGNAFRPGAGSASLAEATGPTGIGLTLVPPAASTFQPLAPLPPAAASLPVTQLVQSPEYGISMFVWGQPRTIQRDLSLATSARFGWQKTLFKWRLIEGAGKGKYDWTEADSVVQASQKAGVKIIARIDFQPDWARRDGAHNGPPDNYQDYWDFISAFTSRYRPGSAIGQVDAIEVWNEVNLTKEWGGRPINKAQATDYVRLLTGAYRAAHAANPNIVVVTAGLSPTGVRNESAWDDAEYLQWLFEAGLKGGVNYDALGAHGNTQAPEVDVPLNSLPTFPHESFYFRRVEQLRDIMVKNGDAARQVWLLEFGWTADQVNPNYAWFAVSEDKKAQNILKAYDYARMNWTPWIGVMTLWTLADPDWTQQREEYWWAVTNPDGTPRPAFTAVRDARLAGRF